MDRPLNNVTVRVGGRAQFHCRATGIPQPEFSWYKNNQYLIQDTGTFVIRSYAWGSRLTVKNIDIIDEGTVKCSASNDAGRVESIAILSVDASIVSTQTER
ncbi:inactive tyrosine-protein kinase transmembrane receptor ROR1-like [Anneissia japonica]|uniref:inactive tyrosine-protein kinase transmembrane receptor ROR1-like n=1 Tax=Anneissia japonica TaxID=1529436 RepID=UPI0014255B8C|nr:inactive tyrosine-protein kinase transmembrane receptor ROR1-like [Anneissia japonica]